VKNQKIVFILGFLREIIHTTFLVYFAALLFPMDSVWSMQNISIILILSAGYLLIPASYLFLLYDDTKFYALIQLLRIGKILRIIVILLISVNEIVNYGFAFLYNGSSRLITFLFFTGILILFFDLIFLYFLLSYKVEEKQAAVDSSNNIIEVHEGANHDNPANS